ncbi:MAG TPA: DUF1080 domain-containing protein [Isosphaeraceae bacterium]|nr:DUF1080 domain-containing protein [Isosphaeraceae bacterium]
MTTDVRYRCLAAALVTMLVPLVGARPDEPSPSALERDPQGWTDLLADAGAGLRGWTRGSVPPGRALAAESQWSLDPSTGMLLCRGDGGHDWVRWDRELADFIFHVEWRFTPVEGKKGYNSGVYVRNSADAKIWHQAQTGSGSGGFLFGDTLQGDKIVRVNFSKQLREQRVKPAGEWNTYEITCKGPKISLWVNGAVTNEWDSCEVPKGFVGLEAEGWRIEFKNVKVKAL